jgi:non-heme chloroperoxidase
MPYIVVGRENSADIYIYYEDHGWGPPVVLIHGYPLSGRAWDKQVPALLGAGYRVITYDRRGFGHSSQPTIGYDYDTFAADLAALLEHLDLREAVLVGHSMGTGEVTRYLGTRGSARVAKSVLVSPIPPYLLATPDNPDGLPQSLFDEMAGAARADTPAWMKDFLDAFYDIDKLRGTRVSDQAWQASWNLAVTASATAAVACIPAWTTDFRADLPNIDVPILVVQGNADRVLPLDKTGQRLPGLIKDVGLVVIEDGPHAILWTHADQVNTAMLDFLGPVSRETFVAYFLRTLNNYDVRFPDDLRSYLLEEVIKPDTEWAARPSEPSLGLDHATFILSGAFDEAVHQTVNGGSNEVSRELLDSVLHEVIMAKWNCPWPFWFC